MTNINTSTTLMTREQIREEKRNIQSSLFCCHEIHQIPLSDNDGVLEPLFDRYNQMKMSLGEFSSFQEDVLSTDEDDDVTSKDGSVLHISGRQFEEIADRLKELEQEGELVKTTLLSADNEKDRRRLETEWFETLKKKSNLLREEHQLALRIVDRRLQEENDNILRELRRLMNDSGESQALEEFGNEKLLLKSYLDNVYQRNIIVENIDADMRRQHAEDDVIQRTLRQHGMTSSTTFDDDFLSVMENESEVWSSTVDEQTLKQMSIDDIRRQNIIWELIQTETNYCRALKTLEQIIIGGMTRELDTNPDETDRLFPKLNDLIHLHLKFRAALRELQNQSADKYVNMIGPVLKEQFSDESGNHMFRVYAAFCQAKSAALDMYHSRMNSDTHFYIFMQRYNKVRLCNKRRIPDFLTMIGARIAQYPLLIERILKATSDEKEKSTLAQILNSSREILTRINDNMASSRQ